MQLVDMLTQLARLSCGTLRTAEGRLAGYAGAQGHVGTRTYAVFFVTFLQPSVALSPWMRLLSVRR